MHPKVARSLWLSRVPPTTWSTAPTTCYDLILYLVPNKIHHDDGSVRSVFASTLHAIDPSTAASCLSATLLVFDKSTAASVCTYEAVPADGELRQRAQLSELRWYRACPRRSRQRFEHRGEQMGRVRSTPAGKNKTAVS